MQESEFLRKLLAPARISTLESLSMFGSFATKKEGFVALFFCGGERGIRAFSGRAPTNSGCPLFGLRTERAGV